MEMKEMDKRKPFRLTNRDREIVRAVYDYRALISSQINTLFFSKQGGNVNQQKPSSRCLQRLRRLYEHGFLHRAEQPSKPSEGHKPFVYFLDKGGVNLLAEMRGVFPDDLDWHPKHKQIRPQAINHLLATNDVRIAIELAAKALSADIRKWLDDSTLRRKEMKDRVEISTPQGKRKPVAIVPDGYCLLSVGEHNYHNFLEIDMGTVTGQSSNYGRRDFSRKIRGYIAYGTSGQYQERYQAQSMRVLIVTTGEKRMENLKAVAEKAGGRDQFWFTTFDKINEDSVLSVPIWAVAGREERHPLVWAD